MNKISLEANNRCPHYPYCPSCQIVDDPNNPPLLNEAKSFFKGYGIDQLSCRVGPAAGWRFRAKLAVRGKSDAPLVGLYKPGTHEIMDISSCLAHHPKINEGIAKLKSFIKKLQLKSYDEHTGQGLIRYVQFIVERSTGRLQIALVVNGTPESIDKNIFGKLWEGNAESFWHSIWLNYNTRKDNVIFGDSWELLHGDELLWEKFLDVETCFQPSSFGQANLDLFEQMLGTIQKKVPEDSTVAEFYAGSGVIGLTLASKCKWVRCGEVNKFAEYCFERSKQKLQEEVSKRISWTQGKSSELSTLLVGADVVIVDPPRKGLELDVLRSITEENSVKRLIYVSCGWESLQRDAKILVSNGWKLVEAEVYMFFPGTNHIETLVIFDID